MTTRRTVVAGGAVVAAWTAAGLTARAQQATPGASPAAGDPAAAFVTISHYRLREGANPTALVSAVRDGFLPIVTAIPDFWEYRLILSADETATSIRTFLTAEGAADGQAAAQDWATRNLADLLELPAFMVAEGSLEVDADAY